VAAITVTHAFVNSIPDDPVAEAAGQTLPSHWNAAHTIAGAGTATVEVDFGSAGDVATASVSATWVTASTILICQVAGTSTADHDIEDALLEQITAHAYSINAGVGFSVRAHAPNGTWGRYNINIVGL
jgi:hypothetical protein